MADQQTVSRAAPEAPRAFDQNLVAALSHPLRVRILDVLLRGVADSPREIAEELGAKVGDVSYHVSKLRSLGAIELVRTEPRRGTLKHFYRATTRTYIDDEMMRSLPPAVQHEINGAMLTDILMRVTNAAEGEGFHRPDAHISSTPLDLDEQGYADVSELLVATLDRAMAIQAEVLERRVATGGADDDGIRTEVTVLHYVMPPGPQLAKVDAG